MIHDSLANAGAYAPLGPRFRAAFDWLSATALESLAEGRVDILGKEGGEVYALVQRYSTEPRAGRSLESHRVYADIQVVLRGEEAIAYRQIDGLVEVQPYEAAKECALWSLEGSTDVLVREGEFAVFLPQDGHAPKLAPGKPAEVRKIVVKVKVA